MHYGLIFRQAIATTANQYAPAKELAQWKQNLVDHWFNIKIENVDISGAS